jgi:hypothetical protein
MKITANAKLFRYFSRNGEAGSCLASLLISPPNRHSKIFLRNGKRRNVASFGRHQPFPRATESQLDSKSGRDQNVDFPGLDFLQITRGNLRSFGQFVLRQFLADALPAHVRAEDLDSLPFFLGNGHDILRRFLTGKMNDTYIVKRLSILLDARLDSIKKVLV